MFRWNQAVLNVVIFSSAILCSAVVSAQSGIERFRYVERTIYVKEPVILSKWVDETVYEKKQVSDYKHVWNTEKREKRTTVKKPVTRTTYREEQTTVQKPVTETKYREKRVEETSYDLVTEMRDQEYTVQKPVVETQYRDEQFTVRQKITEDLIEVKNETVYKPRSVAQTVYVPTDTIVNQTYATNDVNARYQMQWLAPGYYTDPVTGQSIWRRRGMHWVQPTVSMTVADTVPVLVPTTVQQTTLVPETVQTRRPVEIARYEDRIETRRVPVEVQKMVAETVTRQVPVTVKKPVVKSYVEQVPYSETRYVEEVIVTKTPVQETVYEEVTEVEPYEVEVSHWEPITTEIEVPKTIRKRVEYKEIHEVPKTIWMKVRVDENGNALDSGTPVSEEEMKSTSRYTTGYGETDRNSAGRFRGTWNAAPTQQETTERRANSVLDVPETAEPTAANPLQEMQNLKSPSNDDKAKPDEADNTPAIDQSADRVQLSNQIAGLEVVRRLSLDDPSLPSTLPAIDRPNVEPNHFRDVLDAESKIIVNRR